MQKSIKLKIKKQKKIIKLKVGSLKDSKSIVRIKNIQFWDGWVGTVFWGDGFGD